MIETFFHRKKRITVRIATALLTAVMIIGFVPVDAGAKGLTKIDSMTFRKNPDITTIHIGSDVTEITSGAFRCLMNLRSITVSENNPFYTSYSNCLYNKDMTELLCFPAALDGAMIPSSVTTIDEYALYGLGNELKEEIRAVVKNQALENSKLEDIPGEHFIHTKYGVKWRKADGSYVEPDTDIKKLVASVIDACTSENMTQNAQLEKCFNYLVSSASYQREMDVPLGDWTEDYAKKLLMDGKGNCYKYAAAFAYIAKGLGYDARICTGTVQSALGGKTPHAWTEVKVNETWYIFDTEMQDAKGSGYYKQTYSSYPAKPIEKAASFTVSF